MRAYVLARIGARVSVECIAPLACAFMLVVRSFELQLCV